MKEEKLTIKERVDKATKIISEAHDHLKRSNGILRGALQTYWITYKIPKIPEHESTIHCEPISIYVTILTKPEDDINKANAELNFRTEKETELKQKIIILGVYLDENECKEKTEKENMKQTLAKQHITSPRNP